MWFCHYGVVNFLGSPILWNSKPALSWSEILVEYVEIFDSKFNHFWSALTYEILWFLRKVRNEKVFQKKDRRHTWFTSKLTHFFIKSRVSLSLEIFVAQFMMLVRNEIILIHKDDVKAIQYLNHYKDMFDYAKLNLLDKMMEDLNISNDIQSYAPEKNDHEDSMSPDDNALKEYVLARWNDELFSTDFLESLEINDGRALLKDD